MSRGNLARTRRYEYDPEAEYEMDLLWGQPVQVALTRAAKGTTMHRTASMPRESSRLVRVAMNEQEGSLFKIRPAEAEHEAIAVEGDGRGDTLFARSDESMTEDIVLSPAPNDGESLVLDDEGALSDDVAIGVVDDESATEDLTAFDEGDAGAGSLKLRLGGPRSRPVERQPMPALPPRGEIAQLGVRRKGKAPKRIGKGKLVESRLTWKPGDPFGHPGIFRRSDFAGT